MTTGDGWTAAVRDRLAPGRLLPLGTAADGTWLAERAAREVLDREVSAVRGAVPGPLRIGAAADAAEAGPLPVPPGGVPAGPLRIGAELAVVATGRPLPETAEEVRTALLAAAERLGLAVTEVDLRVTELLEEAPATEPAPPPPGRTPPAADDPVALAVLGVPGVVAVTDALGAPVHRTAEAVRVECAVAADRPPAEVARAARAAAAAAAPEGAAVTVVVTELR
ncbi:MULTISPECIES: hypothetical protein [Streptomyces]|uniref:Nucleopolyhedrovirus P10 family protein n=2 Tax=Streptomyces TaxID=1883 RepID=A0ABU4KAH5_9ACTN|nr:hypothetical protein [Streptomyces roseolus]MDX2294761.1 hypothetical protein [Streptomyces roseolus]